ncbi:hypothetical protein Tco_0038383 [Tanacetum coccineum]
MDLGLQSCFWCIYGERIVSLTRSHPSNDVMLSEPMVPEQARLLRGSLSTVLTVTSIRKGASVDQLMLVDEVSVSAEYGLRTGIGVRATGATPGILFLVSFASLLILRLLRTFFEQRIIAMMGYRGGSGG